MIKRLIPLPIPYSSICSPIHIRKIVPAVMMQTHTNPFQNVVISLQDHVHLRTHHVLHPEGALDRAENDGRVAGVFVDALPAALALLHHRLERWDNAGQELKDDRGRDVRHDPQAEDRAHADRRAAEHRDGAEELAGRVTALLLLPVLQLGLVDDRQRDVEADPVDGQEQAVKRILRLSSGTLKIVISLSTGETLLYADGNASSSRAPSNEQYRLRDIYQTIPIGREQCDDRGKR